MKYKMLIDNHFVDGKEIHKIYDKFNNEIFSKTGRASEFDIDNAINSSFEIFPKTKNMSRYERALILERIADGLLDNRQELINIIVAEAGKPLIFARGEVERAILTFKIAEEEAKRFSGEIIPIDIEERVKNCWAYTLREPIGIIFGISPFNFPLNLTAHKVAPAIATGNPIIIKPSSYTPLSSMVLGKIAYDAGILPGMLNIVNCKKIDYTVKNLEVGGVIVNDSPTLRVDNYPYGGVKESGLGREGVKYAMEEMTQLKCVVTRQ